MDTTDLFEKEEVDSQSENQEILQKSIIANEELKKECPTYETAIQKAADKIANPKNHLIFASLAHYYLFKKAVDEINQDMTLSKENAEKKNW